MTRVLITVSYLWNCRDIYTGGETLGLLLGTDKDWTVLTYLSTKINAWITTLPWRKWEDNIKMDLKKRMQGRGLYSSVS
jgi:hypothetical protein